MEYCTILNILTEPNEFCVRRPAAAGCTSKLCLSAVSIGRISDDGVVGEPAANAREILPNTSLGIVLTRPLCWRARRRPRRVGRSLLERTRPRRLVRIASATNGHVTLFASDEFDLAVGHFALGKRRVSETLHADGGELDNVLSQWNQLQNIAESLAPVSAVESGDHNDFTTVRHELGKLDNVGKELTLVNSEDVVVVLEVHKRL